MTQFAGQVESDSLNLLIQNPPEAAKAANEPPEIEDPAYTITCDGGGFFDGNANLLVLLRNVVVTEERFTLRASKEIKVFFDEPKKEDKDEKKEKNEEETPDTNIGAVKTLVATGGVNFSGIDEDGNAFEASAAIASYDKQKKQLILKDGRPSFRKDLPQGPFAMTSESKEANVVITFTETSFNAQVSKNGWTFKGGK
jgi:hypothetical protein